jgi:hypothetical protein
VSADADEQGWPSEKHSLAHVPQPTQQVLRRCIVARQVDNQMACLGANRGVVTRFVRDAESSYMRTQSVVILPRAQFSPACQVPFAQVHATSDRLPDGTAAPFTATARRMMGTSVRAQPVASFP